MFEQSFKGFEQMEDPIKTTSAPKIFFSNPSYNLALKHIYFVWSFN